MNRLVYLAFALALTPCLSLADDPAPADTAKLVDSYAPHTCKKPEIKIKMRKADDDSRFESKADAYKDCMNAYITAQTELSQKHRLAGNAAVAEYNDFVNELNASQQSQSQ